MNALQYRRLAKLVDDIDKRLKAMEWEVSQIPKQNHSAPAPKETLSLPKKVNAQ